MKNRSSIATALVAPLLLMAGSLMTAAPALAADEAGLEALPVVTQEAASTLPAVTPPTATTAIEAPQNAEDVVFPTRLNLAVNQTCQADCRCGNTISCEFAWDCTARTNSYVQCDSQPRVYCPSSTCNANLVCPQGQIMSCNGTCNNCHAGSDYISCNGNVYTCAECEATFQFICSY